MGCILSNESQRSTNRSHPNSQQQLQINSNDKKKQKTYQCIDKAQIIPSQLHRDSIGSNQNHLITIQSENKQRQPPHQNEIKQKMQMRLQTIQLKMNKKAKNQNSQTANNAFEKKAFPHNYRRQNGGMVNLNNTCYLNSALQCLFQTQYLNEQINKDSGLFKSFMQGQFMQLYKEMCAHLQIQDRPFNPSKIKKLIEKNNTRFVGNSQHDSGQVMNTILNIIHDETNKQKNPQIVPIQYKFFESDSSLFVKYLTKFWTMAFSLIDFLFIGFYKTTYLCSICKNQKRLFQKFNTIYLPIPKTKRPSIKLQDCLWNFYQGQFLQWDCLHCKKETEHKKYMQIYKANRILMFCLKRFNEDNTKIRVPIDIPLKLDMNQFAKEKKECHDISQTIYELYAAIMHKGEFNGGHYTAYCYDYRKKTWGEYDDKVISRVAEGQIKKNIQKAYILFYKIKKQQQQYQSQVQLLQDKNYLKKQENQKQQFEKLPIPSEKKSQEKPKPQTEDIDQDS